MVKITGIRFKRAGKVYYFDPGDWELSVGQKAIVETVRGVEMGDVVIASKLVEESGVVQPLKRIIRAADTEDLKHAQDNKDKEPKALEICHEKIRAHKLPMKLVGAEYTFDNSKVIFYFTAEGRVDFRELVKDLASVFKMRIELRQIGVRDEAKLVGGLGPCGLPMCCTTWLGDFDPVSIKMAKEQNLSLNPAKISGICGRLMCCLKFESGMYDDMDAPSQPETDMPYPVREASGKCQTPRCRLCDPDLGPDEAEAIDDGQCSDKAKPAVGEVSEMPLEGIAGNILGEETAANNMVKIGFTDDAAFKGPRDESPSESHGMASVAAEMRATTSDADGARNASRRASLGHSVDALPSDVRNARNTRWQSGNRQGAKPQARHETEQQDVAKSADPAREPFKPQEEDRKHHHQKDGRHPWRNHAASPEPQEAKGQLGQMQYQDKQGQHNKDADEKHGQPRPGGQQSKRHEHKGKAGWQDYQARDKRPIKPSGTADISNQQKQAAKEPGAHEAGDAGNAASIAERRKDSQARGRRRKHGNRRPHSGTGPEGAS